jgi:hypothetical protein
MSGWVLIDLDGTLCPFCLPPRSSLLSLEEKCLRLGGIEAYECQTPLQALRDQGYNILIATGRASSEYGDITIEWLKDWEIPYDALIMLITPWESKHIYYFHKFCILDSFRPALVIDDDFPFLLGAHQKGYETKFITSHYSWERPININAKEAI